MSELLIIVSIGQSIMLLLAAYYIHRLGKRYEKIIANNNSNDLLRMFKLMKMQKEMLEDAGLIKKEITFTKDVKIE